MSFDRLSSLEAQPTTTRRQDDPVYRDDPEFQRFTESLSTKLFELISNISRLSNQISLLGTKRDTERVRERVHDMLEETRDGFKEVGEGIKRAQGWEDLNVGPREDVHVQRANETAIAKIHQLETISRVRIGLVRIPSCPEKGYREGPSFESRSRRIPDCSITF